MRKSVNKVTVFKIKYRRNVKSFPKLQTHSRIYGPAELISESVNMGFIY